MRTMAVIKKLGLVAVAVAMSSLLGMAAEKNEATYTDLFNPLGLPNPLDVPMVGQILDPGKLICLAHTPTGDPMQPCPQGSRILMRGFRMLTRVNSESPSLAGWMTVSVGANLAPDYTGPAWGTFSIQLDAGGTLEGTWNGMRRTAGESVWIAELHITGHGAGGQVEGMQAKCVEVITELTPMPIFYKGVATCRLLHPDDE